MLSFSSRVPTLIDVKLCDPRTAKFEPTLDQVVAARRFASRVVAEAGHISLVPAVALATGELAANAVHHARTPFEVIVFVDDRAVRVEVADGSPDLPRRLDVDPDEVHGRGVMLVDLVGARWGVEVAGGGKRVWVEIEL